MFRKMLAVLALTLCGCGAGLSSGPPAGDPLVEGVVTELTLAQPVTEACVTRKEGDDEVGVGPEAPPVCTNESSGLGGALVESSSAGEFDIGIQRQTKVLLQTGPDNFERATLQQLDGAHVAVWGDNSGCAESYPPQCLADTIVVRPE